MANPKISSTSTIYANNSLVRLTDTSATQLVSNAASSNKVFLVDSIYVANVDGTNSCDITIDIFAAATNTGTATKLVSTVSVPADAVLVPLLKDGTVALLEDRSIYATASAANDLHVITSWKEIS